jgi:hypothetical protein
MDAYTHAYNHAPRSSGDSPHRDRVGLVALAAGASLLMLNLSSNVVHLQTVSSTTGAVSSHVSAAVPRRATRWVTAPHQRVAQHPLAPHRRGGSEPTAIVGPRSWAVLFSGMLAASSALSLFARRRRRPHSPAMAMLNVQGQGPAEVATMVNALRRTAWVPFVEEQPGRLAISRFGGAPVLRAGEDWPTCAKCQSALTLFLQLDLTEIPSEMQPVIAAEGILQVFVCVAPGSGCLAAHCGQTELPPAGDPTAYIVRIIPNDASLQVPTSRISGVSFDPMIVTYWHAVDDYPRTPSEVVAVYPKLAKSPRLDAWDRSNCAWGEKMGGWPLWGASPSYMRCPACDIAMDVVFQLDSDCNLDFVWGNNGTAFVHRCPHCQRMGFSWVDNSSM